MSQHFHFGHSFSFYLRVHCKWENGKRGIVSMSIFEKIFDLTHRKCLTFHSNVEIILFVFVSRKTIWSSKERKQKVETFEQSATHFKKHIPQGQTRKNIFLHDQGRKKTHFTRPRPKKHNNQLFCHRVDFFQGNRHSVQIIIYIVLFFLRWKIGIYCVIFGNLFVRMQMKRKRMQEFQTCPLSLFIEGSG